MTDNSPEASAYTHDEIRTIRHMLDTRIAVPTCPRCQTTMAQEGPLAGGGSVGLVWRVSCKKCNAAALVAESMSRPHPRAPGS